MVNSGKCVRWQTSESRWVRQTLRVGTAYMVLVDLVLLFGSTSPALGILFSVLTILFVLLSEAVYRRSHESIDAS